MFLVVVNVPPGHSGRKDSNFSCVYGDPQTVQKHIPKFRNTGQVIYIADMFAVAHRRNLKLHTDFVQLELN